MFVKVVNNGQMFYAFLKKIGLLTHLLLFVIKRINMIVTMYLSVYLTSEQGEMKSYLIHEYKQLGDIPDSVSRYTILIFL